MNDKKYLIVGLGNAEQQYAGTRHNYGFEVVNALAQALRAEFKTDRLAYVARANYKGRTLVMILPTTYMNLSGKAVKYWLTAEDIAPDHCMVVCDDLDLPVGTFKIKPKGGGGSHNGLLNIIEQLGHSNFPRLRCGIGKDFAQGYQVDYVLGRFSSEELKRIEPCINQAVEAIRSFATAGLQRTMNQYNTIEKNETSHNQNPNADTL
ncbi:MAG: aminoacyl-tRNA hydrolase [Bacteroidales bacterium]|nr:aminoacyl-tRNA hydrolase [Bacteroidales bacterium]MBR6161791.1 aminoacyl-tRNA hydrolase [Bacteroidales bacterium]